MYTVNPVRVITRAIIRWWTRRAETRAYWRRHNALYPGGSTQSQEWANLRLQVIRRDGYRCVSCGTSGRFPRRRYVRVGGFRIYEPFVREGPRIGLQVDHIRPLSRGGTNNPANLQTLCKSCHEAKTGRRLKGPDA